MSGAGAHGYGAKPLETRRAASNALRALIAVADVGVGRVAGGRALLSDALRGPSDVVTLTIAVGARTGRGMAGLQPANGASIQ